MTWDAATSGSEITRALLVELQFETYTLRVHDGIGPISWGGNDWLGVGQLGAISGISGGVDLDASDLTLMLSGVPSEYRAEILTEVARGKSVNIYQGVIDPVAGAWDFEPELVYSGFIDDPDIEEEAAEGIEAFLTITVPVISASSYVRRIQVWRRTDADQQSLFPGDKFFAFKTDMRVPVPTPGQSNLLQDMVARRVQNILS